jgi:uncharacterized lipoprotein YddW (UPF0748 family)
VLRTLISLFLGKTTFQVSVAIIFTGAICPAFAGYIHTNLVPPALPREFRGVWVATVNNIDWPSRPGLPVEEQKREMLGILDRAAQLHLNAILFQVRPGCDAFYESRFEPWSEYLTGKMGTPPAPWYDPLAFAIDEAHKRGLELHAWFNPFRARHVSATNTPSLKHISKANPQMVRSYGKDLWLDPGEPAVRDYTMNVVMDVVRHYDVDGVVMDDYFYPYKEKDWRGKLVDFPDWRSWSRYRSSGGTLTRDEWRRDNINQFVERFYTSVKAEKPHVKVGLSPFGIWRPGFPAQIRGLDAFTNLYADSRLWLQKGWIDYLAPQLYWPINAPNQSFPVLLKWWAEQNSKGRHLWPAGTLSRTNHSAAETINQVLLTRKQPGAGGNIHWHIAPLLRNKSGISDSLVKDVYSDLALVPATPWLSKSPPGPVSFSIQEQRAGVSLSWTTNDAVRFWLLQTKAAGRWNTEILPGSMTHITLPGSPDVVALSLIDRCGLASVPDVMARSTP